MLFLIYLEEILPFPPFFCEINQTLFLDLHMKSGGRCPSTIVASFAYSVSGNNRYIIIGCMLLKKHADLKVDDSKNILFYMHIFNICPFIRSFLRRNTEKQ